MESIKNLYFGRSNYVRVRYEKSGMFTCNNTLKQGCGISPVMFNIELDEADQDSEK